MHRQQKKKNAGRLVQQAFVANTQSMKVILLVEKIHNHHWWGRTSNLGQAFVTGYGENMDALVKNIRDSMKHFQAHKANGDPFWSSLNINEVEFEIRMKDGQAADGLEELEN
jgi:hypothetical protein